MRFKNRMMSRPKALQTATRPVLELLEERRLLSGTLTTVNPDGLPSNNRLIFNTIQTVNATYPNAYHNTSPLELENTGTLPLTINSITTSGPFSVVNAPVSGTVIAVGGQLTITVAFTQTTLPAHTVNETNYTTNTNGGAAITGSLAISTSDTVTPVDTVALAGYWQSQSENNAEPNLQTIANTLAGYQTVIASTQIPDLTEANNTRELYGSEVYSSDWVAADPTQGVSIADLAEFHTEGNVVHSYWYNAATQSSQLLFTSLADEGQTLLPHTEGGSLADATFYPGTNAFGLRVDNEYSDDSINLANGNDGGGGHHFRFYPLVDSTGNTVPNTYLVAMDYAVLQTENFDFQDNVFIVSNIRPATAPPSPTGLIATSGSQPVLSWTPVTYSNLQGYNVYRGTSAAGPFTKLTSTPITGTTFTDTTAPGGLTIYYQVTAVDASSGQESSPDSTTANTPGGPVAVNDTATAYTLQPTTINVLANDTDSSGSISPATVTIVAQPDHGGSAVVDTATGSIRYTSAAGFSGTETFTYDESDNNGATSSAATVTVSVVNPVTTSPTANNDQGYTLQNTAVDVSVLANDVAVTTLNASSVAVTSPSHGTAVVQSDGSILYTPASGFLGADSFTYRVTDNNGQVSNSATVGVNVGVQISSAKGASHKLNYTDTSGSPATITLNRGVANIYFGGTGTSTVITKGSLLNVSGSHLFADYVTMTGTTAASSFSMTSRSTGNLSLTGVAVAGTLGTFNAPQTNLVGNMSFGGLSNLILKSSVITGNGAATITVGSGTKSTSFTVGSISDTSFTSAVAIKSIKTSSWLNKSNTTIAVTAPSLSSLVTTGSFQPSLTLTGTGTDLAKATISGSLGTGYWEIAGNTGSVTVGSAGLAWGATFTKSLSSMVVKSGGLADPIVAGSIGTLSVTGNVTGDVTASTAKSVKINGGVTGATFDFTAPVGRTAALGSLVVTGAVTSSDIITVGNASLVQAGSFASSLVDIGGTSTGTTAATATTGNIGSATLGTIKTTAKSGTVFSDTSVLARQVNSVSLGQVNATTTNTEGVAADVIKGLSLVVNTGKVSIPGSKLTSQSVFSDYLSSKNYTLGTFKLEIL